MKDSEIEVGGTYWRLTTGSHETYPKEMTVTAAKEIDGEMTYKAKSSTYIASELYPSFEAALDGAAEAITAKYHAKMGMELGLIEVMRETGPQKRNLQSDHTKPTYVAGFDDPEDDPSLGIEEEFEEEDEAPY